MASRSALLLLAGSGAVLANDNGLALTPPLGWRSWNLFGAHVNQTLIQNIMDGMVVKHNGVSLLDLGYSDVGLDDNWQACGSPSAAPGMHYHDKDGVPLVNTETFPDMKAMTDHAHKLKLTSGWYGAYYNYRVASGCQWSNWLIVLRFFLFLFFVVVVGRKQLHLPRRLPHGGGVCYADQGRCGRFEEV